MKLRRRLLKKKLVERFKVQASRDFKYGNATLYGIYFYKDNFVVTSDYGTSNNSTYNASFLLDKGYDVNKIGIRNTASGDRSFSVQYGINRQLGNPTPYLRPGEEVQYNLNSKLQNNDLVYVHIYDTQ